MTFLFAHNDDGTISYRYFASATDPHIPESFLCHIVEIYIVSLPTDLTGV